MSDGATAAMRFDEFLNARGVAVSLVDGFVGYVLQVGLPPDWEPVDSTAGVQVWACRDDPRIDEFCANAVLTMHRLAAPLDAGDVFAMLADQQLHSMPKSRERHRDLAPATDGAGVLGSLAMEITTDLGTLDSVSRTRIVTTERETLIAQLTISALHDSPVDRDHVWLTVRTGAATGSASPTHHSAVQVGTTGEVH